MSENKREAANNEILHTGPAAAYVGMTKSTLETWRSRGGGPVFLKLGKAVRYRKSDLDRFLEERARTSTSRVEG